MDNSTDEEAPLISQKPTPLPWNQISIVLLLQLCEPVSSLSIYPYINQLVRELDITGGDERRVGYFAGLVESLFYVTEALTVLQWSRASDHVGRKPILLIGLCGLAVSMLSFGLSRTFWGLVISRCLCGLLNGNIGVMKSVMGELTDSTNRAQGFSLLPVVWATGATLGPVLGGALIKPHDRFPSTFNGKFWVDYPYFLPCLVAASFVMMTFVIGLFFFKETLPRKSGFWRTKSAPTSDPMANGNSPHDGPLPLRKLLVYPVVISVANYFSLALLNMCLAALFPLFLAMPIEIGGLGFNPTLIGYTLGAYGVFTGVWQVSCFAKFVRWLGERNLFVIGMSCFLVSFALLPLTSLLVKQYGMTLVIWICLCAMIILLTFMDMAYGCIFIFVTASAPNKSSLGAVNGLAQTTVSIARAMGPALATSLFSFSVQYQLLGGYAVYLIFVVLSICSVYLALYLPREIWEEAE